MTKRHGRAGSKGEKATQGGASPLADNASHGERGPDGSRSRPADPAGRADPPASAAHGHRSHPRVREGPDFARPSSPGWDLTNLRVRREGKARFDEFRFRASRADRILPHWEAFERLLDVAEGRGIEWR